MTRSQKVDVAAVVVGVVVLVIGLIGLLLNDALDPAMKRERTASHRAKRA